MGAWHGGFQGGYDGIRAQHGFGSPLGRSFDVKATDAQAAAREAAAHAIASGHMTAAGVAVTIPPFGPVVAAGLAVTAGLIELVTAIFHGKRSRKQIVSAAKAAGIPEAEQVPGFTARALKMSPDKLRKTADQLKKKLGKPDKKGKNAAKLQILGAVDIIKSAVGQGRAAPPDAAATAKVDEIVAETPPDEAITEAGTDPGGSSLAMYAIAGIAAAAVIAAVAAIALRKKR
jgi:hypothetical protein